MNLRILRTLITGLCCLFLNFCIAQQTITIAGNDIQDAMLYRNLRPGYEYTVNTNYGNHPRIAAVAWSASGYNSTMRSLLSFNLSAIPSGSVIQSATLYLYSDPTITGSSDANGNSQLSGSNAFYLEKVTGPWSELAVTWNNQPATTTVDRIWVGPSVSTTENKQINIAAMVQGWVNDPATNKGLRMALENEVRYRSRNYASRNHSNTAIRPKLIITFQPPNPDVTLAYKNAIETIFQVDRSYVSTGLLSDYGLFFTNTEKFNGVRSDSNHVEFGEWKLLYTSLYSSRVNTNATVQEPATVFDQINNTAIANNGTIMLAGMHFRYERFKDDALTSNLVYVSDNKIYDTPGRPTTPYEIREAFAIAPTQTSLSGGTYNFMFRQDLFYSNTGKTISSVQGDFGDGAGYRTLTSNLATNITYSSIGEKLMLFRVNYTDGSFKESHTKINVRDIGGAAARYRGLNTREFQFPRPDFNAPAPFEGIAGRALVTIEYTNPEQEIRKPLIIVEGFDAWNILTPDDPDQNFGFNNVIFGATGGLNEAINYLHTNGNFYGTLSDALEGEQYDLIFIDFEEGTDPIQRNAFLVENVIEWVNREKRPLDGAMHANVVMGFSMGGLVARFALRHMEQRAVAHDTRLYISFDSPHQGANVPVGFQAMVSHLNGVGIGFGLPGILTVNPGNLMFGQLEPDLGRAFEMLQTPAARQMLRYHVSGTGNMIFHDNSEFTEFMAEYSAMGYPRLGGIRNVVLANGSECGTNQGYVPYAEFVNVNETRIHFGFWGLLASNLLSPLYLLTTYPQMIIGAPFTTHSDVKTKFIVNALPSQTSQRIYLGEVYVRKKILWTINVNITLFSKSFNSDPSYLALDNAGGGVSDINEIANNLPIDLAITRFSFIPTFSALDIGGGTQAIVNTDLTRSYSPAFPPAAPKNVIAANFFSNPSEGDISNEIHTQVTLRNGRWLFQEIENQPRVFTCSYTCQGTAISLNIAGPSALCSAETYILQNVPPGATISWSHSGNLTYVSGQGTTDYRVSRNSTGDAFVQVFINGSCGNSNIVRRDLTGGTGYSSSDYPVTGPSSVCTNQYAYYSTNSLPLATNYSWFWPTDWQYSGGQGTRFLDLYVTSTSTSGGIGVRVATACDPGGSPATMFTSVSSCGSFMMSAYPNPAEDELIIESTSQGSTAESSKTTSKSSEPFLFSAKLYDDSGTLQKTAESKNGKIIIKTNDLPDGQYYLHITTDIETVTSQVIIKR